MNTWNKKWCHVLADTCIPLQFTYYCQRSIEKFVGEWVRHYMGLPTWEPRIFVCLYMFGHMYIICVLWPGIFCVSSVVDSVPNLTKQNPLNYQFLLVLSKEFELFTAFNSFAGVVTTYTELLEFIIYSN